MLEDDDGFHNIIRELKQNSSHGMKFKISRQKTKKTVTCGNVHKYIYKCQFRNLMVKRMGRVSGDSTAHNSTNEALQWSSEDDGCSATDTIYSGTTLDMNN